jgi:SAM-dependent methyltransferase
MNKSKNENTPLSAQAIEKTYVDALERARNQLMIQSLGEGGKSSSDGSTLQDDALLAIVDAHVRGAESRLRVRTELPSRLQRTIVGRIGPLRRLILRLYELAFREQRSVGHAFIGAWRDFLRSYKHRQSALDKRLRQYDDKVLALQSMLDAVQDEHREEITALRRELSEQLQLVREGSLASKQLSGKVSETTVVPTDAIDVPSDGVVNLQSKRNGGPTGLDAYYLDFENEYRGSRELVRSHLEQDYRPQLDAANIGATARALDIGCGRGEWLNLLVEWGLDARGIDLNPVMAAYCRRMGLDVQTGDGIAKLAEAADESLDLVSAMHVIEHLSFEQMVEFFDQAKRILRPGGLLIVETPNPENLIVGSCNFWNDPTHRQPLPPEATRFLLQSRGFSEVSIARLHPRGEVPAEATGGMRELFERLYIGQDYALIARR